MVIATGVRSNIYDMKIIMNHGYGRVKKLQNLKFGCMIATNSEETELEKIKAGGIENGQSIDDGTR